MWIQGVPHVAPASQGTMETHASPPHALGGPGPVAEGNEKSGEDPAALRAHGAMPLQTDAAGKAATQALLQGSSAGGTDAAGVVGSPGDAPQHGVSHLQDTPPVSTSSQAAPGAPPATSAPTSTAPTLVQQDSSSLFTFHINPSIGKPPVYSARHRAGAVAGTAWPCQASAGSNAHLPGLGTGSTGPGEEHPNFMGSAASSELRRLSGRCASSGWAPRPSPPPFPDGPQSSGRSHTCASRQPSGGGAGEGRPLIYEPLLALLLNSQTTGHSLSSVVSNQSGLGRDPTNRRLDRLSGRVAPSVHPSGSLVPTAMASEALGGARTTSSGSVLAEPVMAKASQTSPPTTMTPTPPEMPADAAAAAAAAILEGPDQATPHSPPSTPSPWPQLLDMREEDLITMYLTLLHDMGVLPNRLSSLLGAQSLTPARAPPSVAEQTQQLQGATSDPAYSLSLSLVNAQSEEVWGSEVGLEGVPGSSIMGGQGDGIRRLSGRVLPSGGLAARVTLSFNEDDSQRVDDSGPYPQAAVDSQDQGQGSQQQQTQEQGLQQQGGGGNTSTNLSAAQADSSLITASFIQALQQDIACLPGRIQARVQARHGSTMLCGGGPCTPGPERGTPVEPCTRRSVIRALARQDQRPLPSNTASPLVSASSLSSFAGTDPAYGASTASGATRLTPHPEQVQESGVMGPEAADVPASVLNSAAYMDLGPGSGDPTLALLAQVQEDLVHLPTRLAAALSIDWTPSVAGDRDLAHLSQYSLDTGGVWGTSINTHGLGALWVMEETQGVEEEEEAEDLCASLPSVADSAGGASHPELRRLDGRVVPSVAASVAPSVGHSMAPSGANTPGRPVKAESPFATAAAAAQATPFTFDREAAETEAGAAGQPVGMLLDAAGVAADPSLTSYDHTDPAALLLAVQEDLARLPQRLTARHRGLASRLASTSSFLDSSDGSFFLTPNPSEHALLRLEGRVMPSFTGSRPQSPLYDHPPSPSPPPEAFSDPSSHTQAPSAESDLDLGDLMTLVQADLAHLPDRLAACRGGMLHSASQPSQLSRLGPRGGLLHSSMPPAGAQASQGGGLHRLQARVVPSGSATPMYGTRAGAALSLASPMHSLPAPSKASSGVGMGGVSRAGGSLVAPGLREHIHNLLLFLRHDASSLVQRLEAAASLTASLEGEERPEHCERESAARVRGESVSAGVADIARTSTHCQLLGLLGRVAPSSIYQQGAPAAAQVEGAGAGTTASLASQALATATATGIREGAAEHQGTASVHPDAVAAAVLDSGVAHTEAADTPPPPVVGLPLTHILDPRTVQLLLLQDIQRLPARLASSASLSTMPTNPFPAAPSAASLRGAAEPNPTRLDSTRLFHRADDKLFDAAETPLEGEAGPTTTAITTATAAHVESSGASHGVRSSGGQAQQQQGQQAGTEDSVSSHWAVHAALVDKLAASMAGKEVKKRRVPHQKAHSFIFKAPKPRQGVGRKGHSMADLSRRQGRVSDSSAAGPDSAAAAGLSGHKAAALFHLNRRARRHSGPSGLTPGPAPPPPPGPTDAQAAAPAGVDAGGRASLAPHMEVSAWTHHMPLLGDNGLLLDSREDSMLMGSLSSTQDTTDNKTPPSEASSHALDRLSGRVASSTDFTTHLPQSMEAYTGGGVDADAGAGAKAGPIRPSSPSPANPIFNATDVGGVQSLGQAQQIQAPSEPCFELPSLAWGLHEAHAHPQGSTEAAEGGGGEGFADRGGTEAVAGAGAAGDAGAATGAQHGSGSASVSIACPDSGPSGAQGAGQLDLYQAGIATHTSKSGAPETPGMSSEAAGMDGPALVTASAALHIVGTVPVEHGTPPAAPGLPAAQIATGRASPTLPTAFLSSLGPALDVDGSRGRQAPWPPSAGVCAYPSTAGTSTGSEMGSVCSSTAISRPNSFYGLRRLSGRLVDEDLLTPPLHPHLDATQEYVEGTLNAGAVGATGAASAAHQHTGASRSNRAGDGARDGVGRSRSPSPLGQKHWLPDPNTPRPAPGTKVTDGSAKNDSAGSRASRVEGEVASGRPLGGLHPVAGGAGVVGASAADVDAVETGALPPGTSSGAGAAPQQPSNGPGTEETSDQLAQLLLPHFFMEDAPSSPFGGLFGGTVETAETAPAAPRPRSHAQVKTLLSRAMSDLLAIPEASLGLALGVGDMRSPGDSISSSTSQAPPT